MAQTLIIIPTYNEVENIAAITGSILHEIKNAHILFVDDNSKDGTKEAIAREAEKVQGTVHTIHRPRKLGLGTAYLKGFQFAVDHNYEYVVQMDADLSHNPCYVPHRCIPLLPLCYLGILVPLA